MNELALFAGAGGGLLATQHLLGFRTVCAVELDEYCRRLLCQRQNERSIGACPIWDDVCTFDGRPWRGVANLVTGGFPCQPYSTAARGRNNAVDLWPEMLRIVAEVAPLLVFAENVTKRAIDYAADDLESLGYSVKCISLSAKDLGADHVRERHWLLAYPDSHRELCRAINAEVAQRARIFSSFWETEPREPRVADGMASRVEPLRASGNGQSPVVAAAAFTELARRLSDERHESS